MRNFDIKRFWNTIKWYFYENRGKLIKWLAGTALVTALLELLFCKAVTHNVSGSNNIYITSVQAANLMCMVMLFVAICYVLSCVFSFLKTKQKRIAFLTLPSTNLERWLTAVIFATIIMPACIILGYLLADLLRNVIFYIQGEEWVTGWHSLTIRLREVQLQDISWMDNLLDFALGLWGVSFYILGGTWLRKGQFVIITLAQLFLTTALSYLAIRFGALIPTLIVEGGNLNHPAIGWTIITMTIAISIFNFWLSYRIFKKFQIITSKWTNV